jgi:hypothetical protein
MVHTLQLFSTRIQSIFMEKQTYPSENISDVIPHIENVIFQELEIVQRTQLPPSDELIARLNQLASKPPFCYTQKPKKHETR